MEAQSKLQEETKNINVSLHTFGKVCEYATYMLSTTNMHFKKLLPGGDCTDHCWSEACPIP